MKRMRHGGQVALVALLAVTLCAPAFSQPDGCWIRDVAAQRDEAAWVLCDNGLIYRTEDGGRTWALLQPGQTRLRAIGVGSGGLVVLAGAEGLIMVSEDGGETWVRREAGVGIHLNSVAIQGDRIWIAGNEGTILHSRDRGRTWSMQWTFTRNNLESVWFLDGRHGWAVGWNGTVIRTADGGEFWGAVSPPGLYQVLTAAWFKNPQEGWVVGVGGIILYTRDGGASWSRIPSPDPGWLRSILFAPDGTGYIAGERILASTDGGFTWRPLAFEAREALIAIVLHRGRLWVFGPHTLATSGDGGNSWVVADNLFGASRPAAVPLPG